VDPRLLDYYNTELAYLREAGAEFAAEFPKIAARLDLRGFEVADPYVERLLEGMAFLSARVQLKMDAEFPRFAQRLLEVIYPNYLAPTPSICVVQFTPGEMPGGAGASFTLPRGQRLRAAAANETRRGCEFRTAHEVELWPLTLETARLEGAPGGQSFGASARRARAALRLVFQLAAPLSGGAEPPDRLPLYLNASPDLATRLYELVCGHGIELQLRCTGKTQGAWQTMRTPGAGVFGIGFDESESLLPYSSRGFQGYRLLHEYFACPARFNFIELRGLRAALRECEGLKSFEVRLLLDQHGYSEAKLQSAWRNRSNQDIAASIIGYIRQAALGEALLPFDTRIATAMQRIYALTQWNPVQRKWLERLAKQLHHEVVIDQQFVNRAFVTDGGAKQVNKVLGGQLDQVLGALAEGLWSQAA